MKELLTERELEQLIIGYAQADENLASSISEKFWLSGIVFGMLNLIKRVAYEYVYVLLRKVWLNMFISTADADGLELHLKDRGLEPRKKALKSDGNIRIGSKIKPTSKKAIPKLTIVGTNEANSSKQFVLDYGSYVDETTPADDRGFYTVIVGITSMETGAEFNVDPDEIDTLYTDINGIDVVYNENATENGRDLETVEEIATRIKAYDNVSQPHTKEWFVYKALEFDWVKDAIAIPRYQGRGTLGLALLTPSGVPTESQKNEISLFFNGDDNDPAGVYFVIPIDMDIYYWDANITVFYTEIEPDTVQLDLAITDYFKALIRGEKIILNQIISKILNCGFGIKNAEITQSSGEDVESFKYPQPGTINWTLVKYDD